MPRDPPREVGVVSPLGEAVVVAAAVAAVAASVGNAAGEHASQRT